MEVKKINWEDKIALDDLEDVKEINKVTALNMNEIKEVVNNNGDFTLDEINKLQTQIDQIVYKGGVGINVEDKTINIDSESYTKWNNYETLINDTISKIDSSTTQLNEKINLTNASVDELSTKVDQNNQSTTEKINTINSSIEGINNSISAINTQLTSKQDKITVGEGLQFTSNLLAIQSQLLTKWNGYQTFIETNQSNIEKNNDAIDTLNNDVKEINKLIQQIIEGLQQFPIFEIVGDWVSGTTYRKNQAVYHTNKLWNSKINNNTKEPSLENEDAWFLISSFEIPVDNFVTNDDLQNALRTKQDVLSGSNGVVVSQENKQISIEPQLLTKWNGYQTLIQTNQSEIVKTNNNVDAINKKITPIENSISEIKEKNTQQDTLIQTNLSSINTLKTTKQDNLSFNANQFTKSNNSISLNTTFTSRIDTLETKANKSVTLDTEQTITGKKIMNSFWCDDAKIGLISDKNNNSTISVGSQSFYKIFKYTSSFTFNNDRQIVDKGYIDGKIRELTTQISTLNKEVNKFKEYSKTGIIKFVIWNQNGYKMKIIPIQTPPSLVGRENEIIANLHVSTSTSKVGLSNFIYQEWEGGQYVALENPRMNEDLTVNSWNTTKFRDNNITMNWYMWINLNSNLATYTNGDWAAKVVVPITSRYDRNGQVSYVIYKAND